MKFSLVVVVGALAAITIASAFVVEVTPPVRPPMVLHQSRTDASAAIQAAQEATNKYGPTSPEAKVAWDTVEEMDSSDNSVAYTGTTFRMLSKEQVADAAKQYKSQLDRLNLRQDGTLNEKLAEMRAIAEEMASIRIEETEAVPAQDSPALRVAVQAAKEAAATHGATSGEARVAWETVEEIASAGLDNALGGMMEEECWVDMSQTCVALEEVDRFINLVNSQDKGLNS